MYLLLFLAWGDDCFKALFGGIFTNVMLGYIKTKEVKSWLFLLILFNQVKISAKSRIN